MDNLANAWHIPRPLGAIPSLTEQYPGIRARLVWQHGSVTTEAGPQGNPAFLMYVGEI
jgi:hypothetical protein